MPDRIGCGAACIRGNCASIGASRRWSMSQIKEALEFSPYFSLGASFSAISGGATTKCMQAKYTESNQENYKYVHDVGWRKRGGLPLPGFTRGPVSCDCQKMEASKQQCKAGQAHIKCCKQSVFVQLYRSASRKTHLEEYNLPSTRTLLVLANCRINPASLLRSSTSF